MLAGGVIGSGLALFLFFLPVPLWTSAEGVVWLPERSVVRAGTDCDVVEVMAPVGQVVAKDTPLIRGADPYLQAEIDVLRARLNECYAEYNALPLHDRVGRKILLKEIEHIQGDLSQRLEKQDKLLVCSPERGKFVLLDERNLAGRFVRQGEVLGFILSKRRPTIRAVVRQSDIGLIREKVTGVEVRMADRPERLWKADIERIVPSAGSKLPSAALGTTGGGEIPVDPSDPAGLRAMVSVFQIDLGLEEEFADPHIGGRAYVRFEHDRMPLAQQLYRNLVQLFLRKLYA
jgi:putative peptide zinc metalloprotease protein